MYSQTANTDFANQMNNIFQHLDKNRVPHGILTDFGLDYVDLSSYSGSLSTTNYTSRATVHEAYYDLISSRIRQVSAGFMQPQDFEKLWHNHRTENIITVGGLYFKYAKFKDDARTTGKINVINNKLYDVFSRGIWQNPYEEKSTFILAPSINSYKGLNFQVKLPQDIVLSNYPSQIQSIAIDFQDGQGYRIINYNQTVNVNYAQANTYIWKFKLTLTNGQILYSHSEIEIKEGLQTKDISSLKTSQTQNAPTSNTAQSSSNLDDYFKTTVTATTSYYGKNATATLFIRDANNDGIRNPLIVAEGFDTGVILNPEQEAGDNNIERFLEGVEDGGLPLENQIDTYDIIYVDWDNGVDFIQRNAFAFEEAIRWVNDNKIGDTPNTVIGQSMGGLIARYALANIEQNGDFNHDTTLYISHDAPHLGANTPIGMQHMYRHVNNMYQSAPLPLLFGEVLIPLAFDASGIYEDIVNSFGGNVSTDLGTFVTPSQYLSVSDLPASRQMLYNWVNTDYEIRNAIHDAWQQDLSAMGYPQGYNGQPIRNIAIANGSECGVAYAHDTSLIRYEKTAADKTILNSIIGLTDIGVGLTLSGTWQGAVLVVLGVLPGSSKYDIIFNASAMTNLNQNKQIYYGRITYKKKILWFIPVSVNLTREEKHQPNGILPYDTYGGGAYTIENYLGDLFDVLPTLENNGTFGRYGFIPSASALDAGQGIVNLNNNDYKRNYVGGNPPPAPKDSPFQNFVTHFDPLNLQNNNSEHISFNRRNGDWLVAELTDNPDFTNCSFVCGGSSTISGVNQFCTGTRTFSVPAGADTYQWQFFSDPIPMNDDPLTGNATIISATNTNMITVNHTGNRSGWYNLRVVINSNRCGVQNLVLTKRVYIGAPTVDSISVVSESEAGVHLSPGINNCEVALGLNFNPNNNDITDIEWEKITMDVPWSRDYVDYSDRYVYLFPECNKEFKFRVRAKNSCGFWSPWRELTYDITECSTTCQTQTGNIVSDNFILYPVPANTILTFGVQPNNTWNFPSSSPFVNLNDLNTDPTIDGSGNITYPKVRLLISFYNSMGNLIYSTTIQGLPNQMDVSSLPTGNYIMTIEYLGQIETHNIQIN